MSFRLDLDKKPVATARKTLAKRLAKAAERERQDDAVAALHEARKDLKKSRSLLRILRPAMGDDLYAREMASLREIAQALSGARDAEVLPVAFARLRADYPSEVPEAAYTALEARLADEARAIDGSRSLAGQSAGLGAASRRVREWPLQQLSWDDVAAQLEATFRRGRKAMRGARRQPSDENLHEWRKRVKDLLYQLRLLEAAWPGIIEAHAAQSHRLADLLGDDHDLAVLRSVLCESTGAGAESAQPVEPLVTVVERRRLELQAEAWLLGMRIYGEGPKALRRRVRGLIRVTQSDEKRGTTD